MNQFNQKDKRGSFGLPENYFNDFPMAMMEQIEASAQPKKRSRFFASAWTYAAAAVFVGVLFWGQYFLSAGLKSTSFVETYDSYVLSQVDENAMLEFYFVAENEE